jgi:hypothetical protein
VRLRNDRPPTRTSTGGPSRAASTSAARCSRCRNRIVSAVGGECLQAGSYLHSLDRRPHTPNHQLVPGPSTSYESSSTTMDRTDSATLALRVIGALIALFVVHVVWQWRRLSHIPGPLSASFSKWWMVKESLKARQPNSFKELNDKYGGFSTARSRLALTVRIGSLVRVGPNELVTDDPEVLRRMMAVRSGYTRGPCERPFPLTCEF